MNNQPLRKSPLGGFRGLIIYDMKKTIIVLLAIAVCLFTSCDPSEEKLNALVPNTGTDLIEKLNPKVTIDPASPRVVNFSMDEANGVVGVWKVVKESHVKFGFSRTFKFQGDYEAVVFAYDKNGPCEPVMIPFTVTESDPEICDSIPLTYLTGGCGFGKKTWVLDSKNQGYYGLGGFADTEPVWWPADPGSHNGVYDDELTFFLDEESTFYHETNGTSGQDSEEIDFPAYEATWKLLYEYDSEGNLTRYIQLTGNGFFPPRSTDTKNMSNNQKYELLELTENVLRVKIIVVPDEGDISQAWFYRFVPK